MPFGIALAQGAATQAAGNLINEGMGIAFQGIKNKQQRKQARHLQDLQLEGEATRLQRNEALAMRMWENTGYGATVDQMKRAGLNPGLMYGMGGGAGGATAQAPASGGGASAGTAQASSGNIGMGVQLGLMDAQRKNIEADTAQKIAETTKTSGVDTTKTGAEIDAIKQGIENAKVQKTLMEVQDSILRQDLYEKYKTQDWRFSLMAEEAKEKIGQARSAMAQAGVDEKTAIDKVEMLKAQAIGARLLNEKTKTETGAIKVDAAKKLAEITKIGNDIMLDWAKLSLEEKKVKLQGLIERQKTEQGYQANQGVWRTYENETKMIDYIDEILGLKVNNKNQ